MPLYGYTCTTCEKSDDYLVKMNDPVPACKQCGLPDHQEKQLSTGTGFLLMGYGWSKNGMNSKRVDHN